MSVARTITVAAGPFAPGHLGELTRIVPFELADAVVEEARARERRVRLLPSRTGVYFLLAMCLFPQLGYLGVWGRMTAALDGLELPVPSAKALRDLRRRVGAAPVRALFEVLAGPLGRPATPGVMFGGYRTVSFDGCRTVKVPDTPANRGWLGKMNASLGVTGYPVLQLMTLVETGTRALLGAVFGPPSTGELDWARQLLRLLDATMLVLMDRGFDAGDFLAQVAATRAQYLVRLNANRRPPVLRHLPDGSFTSLIGGVKVRVITASVTVTCHDGTRYGGEYRLATTLLDHRAFPAAALMALYHERWQHEVTYLALRHTLLQGRILRSGDPAGLRQEAWALLALYQALRTAITDAVQSAPGTDPRPGQLPGRRHHRPGPPHHRPQHHRPRRRPGRRHRPRRPGPPARPPPAPRLPPPRQVPAVTLGQAPARQAHRHQDDHPGHHPDPPRQPRTRDTPKTIRDKHRRTLTPRH